jgi:hypothetical protein
MAAERSVRWEEPSGLVRGVGITAIFLVGGPLVAGLVAWLSVVVVAAFVAWHRSAPPEAFFGLAKLLGRFVFNAYLSGAPFALVSGIIHAVVAIRWRHNSILVPLFSVCVLSLFTVALFVWREGPNIAGAVVMLYMPLSLVASLMCWRLTRRLARTA